jgi:hypothetical protein
MMEKRSADLNRQSYTIQTDIGSPTIFDIEYQTYGWVWAQPKESMKSILLGTQRRKAKFEFHSIKKAKRFLGINTFGIRMRHEFLTRYLQAKKTVDYTGPYDRSQSQVSFYQI